MEVSGNRGYLILGSKKDPTMYLGYYSRVPYFRKLPCGSTMLQGFLGLGLRLSFSQSYRGLSVEALIWGA